MDNKLSFDFSVDKENNTIRISREFAAERPLVWDAYTKSEILDQWWAPKPWKARTKTMDFREGGLWHYAMVGPAGEEHWALAKYHEIQTLERFTGTDVFADEDGNVNTELPQSAWDLRFTAKGAFTLVEFHISYPDLAQLEASLKMGFREGLSLAMEGLDALLPNLKK